MADCPDQIPPGPVPRHVLFVLLPGFTLISQAGALDCLRLANRAAGRTLYTWRIVAQDGADTACSAGPVIRPDGALPQTRPGDIAVLCGGLGIRDRADPALLDWLVRAAARGTVMAGICTGSYLLARAGLLEGRRATIHWENAESLARDFPAILLTRAVFVEDGNRLTCAGGTAVIDMMLSLIARDHGPGIAADVADQLLHSAIRSGQDMQRLSLPSRMGVRHDGLARVIGRMEASVAAPPSPALLAAEAGLSVRQLERLFRRYLGRSPKRYFLELRLQKARQLLLQTEMGVPGVAAATGFASATHFSRCYRAQYGTTPYRDRGAEAPAAPPAPKG
ncbi:GlxA family transcriptional regulator [Mangrovicoccus algicola]|uniref:GlxA family transcriptional regulator n=1 Tax=Mangrovicoccus algicola TaxID=2771008 RepID=A0A8J6Z9P7_9RHOB|nr:GlxA family transcriptional regulator [Mangrovicoccus algicola]MBE3638606.1 GlxA family transcriptional regulator [Mangrovicoccus algicola]